MSHLFPAFIEGIGGPELMMIMFVVLLLFGANKLPELARGMGKSIREFKKAASGVEEEIKRAIEEEPEKTAAKKSPTLTGKPAGTVPLQTPAPAPNPPTLPPEAE
jgi:TatA/E family protein of Tat protein translocase